MFSVTRATRVFCVAGLPLLAACATPSVLSNRATDFNDTITRAADAQLLLNVVRAAYRNPTHYTAISQMRDVRITEGSFETTANIPIGPDAARIFTLVPKTNVKASASPSFDVVPLDNRAAAQGLFRSVDAQVFHSYWSQGWPQSVLLALFVDRIEIRRGERQFCPEITRPRRPSDRQHSNTEYSKWNYIYIDNSPEDLGKDNSDLHKFYGCVRENIRLVEESDKKTYIENGEISDLEIMKKLPDLIKDDFSLKRESKNIYTIWKTKKNWVFRLGPDGRAAKVSTETGKDEEPPVIFRLRSVDSMIYFLGEIVRLQLRNHQLPQIRVGEREALSVLFRLHIDAGRDLGDRVEVGFLGKRFAIARKGDDAEDERTLTVFALVSQLFSLYRESTDLPKTSAVQIIGSQ